MGIIEALQKKIDQIADKVRHLRQIIIVLMSAIIGVIFGISQNKVKDDFIVDILLILGTIIVIIIGFLIKNEEKKRNMLIDKLEKKEKD